MLPVFLKSRMRQPYPKWEKVARDLFPKGGVEQDLIGHLGQTWRALEISGQYLATYL